MSARKPLIFCLVLALLLLALAAPGAAQADFGIKSFSAGAFKEDGKTPELRAGWHPYEFKLAFEMNQDAEEEPEGTLRELTVDLPPGMIGNPLAVEPCSGADFEGVRPNCPGNTQIGVAFVRVTGVSTVRSPIYNLTPPLGVVASIGFSIASNNVFNEASLRSGDYGARISDITIPTSVGVQSVEARVWGVPAAPAHDPERFCFGPKGGGGIEGCPSDAARVPFLSLPTSCGPPLKWTLSVKSVQEPEASQSASVESVGPGGVPRGLEGCDGPPFEPKISLQPETAVSDSPTGLHVNLHLPQKNAPVPPELPAAAHLKDTVVTLPAGLAVNPSAADGLAGCPLVGPEGINLPGSGEPAQSEAAKCPDNSKVGTVSVRSPLVDHPLNGAVYLARQGENPFGSLIALYVAVEDPQTGIVVKLAGKVEPDPITGQLTATFLNNPQLPFEDFDFDFSGGPRAALTTPPTCGTYKTTSELTPWTAPEGGDAFPSSPLPITSGPGGACAGSEAQMPNAPSFEAGSVTPLAGAYSPFVVKISRENGSQRLSALNLTLPPGVSAKLAGADPCSDAQLAAAAARNKPGEGIFEKRSPSCPASSQLGVVNVGAGSGSPFYVQGAAYLAGPYKGAPLSLAIVTPAVAGPFDLGTVVVRAGLYVNEETAQVTVKSDLIPQILEGIPLDVRSVAVKVDRDQFTLNPTSCDEMLVTGAAVSTTGASAPLSNRFQVGACGALSYAPKLNLRFKGSTKRTANPKVIATLTAKPGEANTSFAQVKLPPSAFLDNSHIKTICTRVQFNAGAGNGASCPADSVYGRAEATTPLLDYTLKGTVFLRASSNPLPDLVVAFSGPDYQPIHFALAGKTDSVNGALRNTFQSAPDVPVTKFRLELFGGKRGLVEMSDGFCAHPNATVKLRAHSGAAYNTHPKVQAKCGGGKKPKRHSSR